MASYQGGALGRGCGGREMVVNPDAPPITKAEFTRATQIFSSAAPAATVCCAGATGKAAHARHHPRHGQPITLR